MNDDRPNRFTTDTGPPPLSHRERAASQPPRTSDQPFLSSPIIPSRSPWSNQGNAGRLLSPTSGPGGGGSARAIPVPMPSRSASFSAQQRNSTSSSYFGSAMRDRTFSSTFEDDEDAEEFPSDDAGDYDFVGRGFGDNNDMSPSSYRGRQFAPEWSRSRSQSLATTTARVAPMPIGSPSYNQLGTGSAFASWNEGLLSGSNSLNVPGTLGGGRWGDLRPPIRNPTDISNQSPFVRDVGQILLEESSQFKQLWNQNNGGRDRDEVLSSAAGVSRLGGPGFARNISAYGQLTGNGGNVYGAIGGGTGYGYGGGGMGSGTSSRRHSVSVVQPRRGVQVGFDTGGQDEVFGDEDDGRPDIRVGGSSGGGGARGLMLSDDDLLGSSGDMGMGRLSLNTLQQSLDAHLQSQQREGSSPGQSQQHTPQGQQHNSGTASASSSLPIYAPLSRSPPGANDLVSSYRPMNLSVNVQGGDGSSSGRSRDTPSERSASPSKAPGNPVHTPQQQQQQHFFPSQQQQQFNQPQPVNEGSYAARARATSQSGVSSSPTATRGPGYGILPGIHQQQPQHQQGFFPHPQQQHQIHQAHPHAQQQPHIRQPSNDAGHGGHQSGGHENTLGKGVPLSAVPTSWPLFIVEFKAGRTDLFYLTDQVAANISAHTQNGHGHVNGHQADKPIKVGDLVIVEADRGRDLGRVVNDNITVGEVERWLESKENGTQFWSTSSQQQQGGGGWGDQPMSPTSAGPKKEINPKMIIGKAGAQEATQLATKLQDEAKALQLCQSKVRAKKLPMEVVDAEYQWDRRKLTFYFVAEKRIDFRELVRELFRLYKTRIWMASLQSGGGYEG